MQGSSVHSDDPYAYGVKQSRSKAKKRALKVAQVRLPPEEPLPPVPDPSKPGRRFITRDQKRRRYMTIYAMIRECRHPDEIRDYARQIYRIGPRSTDRIIGQIFDELANLGRTQDLPRERERHAQRLELRLRQATSATKVDENGNVVPDPAKWKWSAISQLERLVGQVRGTLHPERLDVGGSIGVHLAGVIATMDEDELVLEAAKQVELERKALERDRLVIDAVPALPAPKASSAA